MMRYRRLPLEDELERVEQEDKEAFFKARSAYLVETLKTRGFQLITGLLRNQEKFALDMLRVRRDDPQYFLGWLHCISEIRRLITSQLPESAQTTLDWSNEEEEAFLIMDESQPSGEGEEE